MGDAAEAKTSGTTRIAPLLKWPGGKRALLNELMAVVPTDIRQYYEPFFGGGALFFALQHNPSVLADKNEELMNCYVQVRDRPDVLIGYLSRMENTEADYYAIRARTPTDELERAARLIYLATLSFNGIHRVNPRGQFNVPYGRKGHLHPCDSDRIHAISRVLACADLRTGDFGDTVHDAQEGDLIYFDPPYTVAHGSNGFLKYNAKIFSWADQERLANLAQELARRGCFVRVSNADHPSIESLYSGFQMKRIMRPSVIAASRSFRRSVTECVFYN